MVADSDESLIAALRRFGEQALAEILSAKLDRLLRIVDLRLDPRLAGRLDAADVVILRHFEQLTNDEVAGVLGVKKAAASRRYTRAVTRFQQMVEAISGLQG